MDAARPAGTGHHLSPEQRRATLDRMRRERFDVLVIGGGVTGVGTALDAATRGLSVALVEARDYAAGTSSQSSKLIHGGLRYLEKLDFHLVREALRERGLLLHRLAPHLVKPVPFLYPLKHRGWERFYVGAGVILYDTMGGARQVPSHRHLTRRRALRVVPALKRDSLVGAIQYHDAQVDDARHTLVVARTAAAYGAAVATSVEAAGFLREGGRVAGVHARDVETGDEFEIRASQVVSATGVWTDEIQEMVARGRIHVRASKGIHVTVPRDRIHSDSGMILRTEKSVLFIIPWFHPPHHRHWLIGTTDTDWTHDKANPAATRADIEYLLDHVNAVISPPIGPEDIEGVFAGLRPLITGSSTETAKLSREHAVSQVAPGLLTVAGGKYTTYRVMAKDAIDAVARSLPQAVPPSCTDVVPLLGATGYQALWNARERLAEESGLHPVRIEHLIHRYGGLLHELLDLVAARPELGDPIEGADEYLAAEAYYAASHEGAVHLDDVLTRRTRISFETFDRGVVAADPVAETIAEPLGWSSDDVRREVDAYQRRVAAERESQEQWDDAAADAARLTTRDTRAELAKLG